MFIKLVLAFVALLEISIGLPLETAQPAYDVKSFLGARIVGGVDAPRGHSKHMVALIIDGIIKSLVCGASIITERHVMTAAHCIEPFVIWGQLSRHFVGVAGSNYWKSTDTKIRFSGYRNHPEWNSHTIKNDIGILFAEKTIKFTEYIGPIPLHYGWVGGNVNCSVAGWGRLGTWENIPYFLQLLYVQTLEPEECIRRMAEASPWGHPPPVEAKIEICTLHSVGHGMCNGDSGSALVPENHRVQIGIVSWGFPCALGIPDVFVRISGFRGFIQSTTGISD